MGIKLHYITLFELISWFCILILHYRIGFELTSMVLLGDVWGLKNSVRKALAFALRFVLKRLF